MAEDEMVGWHHRLNGHGFEQIPGDGGREKPGVLQTMESQRVGHNSGTEQLHFLLYVLHGEQSHATDKEGVWLHSS